MTEEQHEGKSGSRMDSVFWKALLVVMAAFLTFVGPTYFVYAAVHALNLDFTISMVSGFALFAVGFALIIYLIKKKVIT